MITTLDSWLTESQLFLVGNTNDTTSRTSTSVASLLGFLVSSSAEVISAGMDNNGAPQYALSADQLDQFVLEGTNGIALGISWNVTEIADVALAIARSPVRLPERIEVRTGRRAAIGIVAKLMNVHASFGIRIMAGDVP